MHDLIFSMGVLCLVIPLFIFLLKQFHQPYLIAYIVSGACTLAQQAEMIDADQFKGTVSVIVLSLLLSIYPTGAGF